MKYKYKVGDHICSVIYENLYTITAIKDKQYILFSKGYEYNWEINIVDHNSFLIIDGNDVLKDMVC